MELLCCSYPGIPARKGVYIIIHSSPTWYNLCYKTDCDYVRWLLHPWEKVQRPSNLWFFMYFIPHHISMTYLNSQTISTPYSMYVATTNMVRYMVHDLANHPIKVFIWQVDNCPSWPPSPSAVCGIRNSMALGHLPSYWLLLWFVNWCFDICQGSRIDKDRNTDKGYKYYDRV